MNVFSRKDRYFLGLRRGAGRFRRHAERRAGSSRRPKRRRSRPNPPSTSSGGVESAIGTATWRGAQATAASSPRTTHVTAGATAATIASIAPLFMSWPRAGAADGAGAAAGAGWGGGGLLGRDCSHSSDRPRQRSPLFAGRERFEVFSPRRGTLFAAATRLTTRYLKRCGLHPDELLKHAILLYSFSR